MTRPMPGPPECTCIGRGNGCLTCLDAIGYDLEAICPGCPVHAVPSRSESKRLTGAECVDEYERAFFDFLRALPRSSEVLRARERLSVWERFTTRPHALDAT